MDWNELVIVTSNEAIEAVSNILMEEGAGGVQIDDQDPQAVRVITYFTADSPLNELLPKLKEKVHGLKEFGINPEPGQVFLTNIGTDTWRDKWKEYYQPIRVTRYLTIVPQWIEYEPQHPDEQLIVLDPGRSFGTGDHPTTRLTLHALEATMLGGETVIDVGTGSGILSIAARYLGAQQIVASDVADEALAVAATNFSLNGMTDDIVLEKRDLVHGLDLQADIVAANILPEFLLPLIPQVHKNLRPTGKLILSGIIMEKENEIVTALNAAGFQVEEKITDGKWLALVAHNTLNS